MYTSLFLTFLSVLLGSIFFWSCRNLPKERWQMLAAIPLRQMADGRWQAVNLTFYGLFISFSITFSLTLFCILLGAADISVKGGLTAALILLALCLPAARIIAMLVEGKKHTFTVGGAFFVGSVAAPWVVFIVNELPLFNGYIRLPVVPVLAAMSIAYCLGEGIGRLACISFGCCYGKPLKNCRPLTRSIFSHVSFIFYGKTKKAVYAGQLAGEPLLPVQAITSLVLMATALFGCALYLQGEYRSSLFVCCIISQVWRFFSESLRADFRGSGEITVYQRLALPGVFYTLLASYFFDSKFMLVPNIARGLELIWQPWLILAIQCSWLISFLYFGWSTVTGSTVSFLLKHEHV